MQFSIMTLTPGSQTPETGIIALMSWTKAARYPTGLGVISMEVVARVMGRMQCPGEHGEWQGEGPEQNPEALQTSCVARGRGPGQKTEKEQHGEEENLERVVAGNPRE